MVRQECLTYILKISTPLTGINQNSLRSSKKIQNILDSGAGECLLRNKGNAQIVADAMLFFDNQRYKLGHWVIMPNHVHLVVKPINGYSLSDILHSWKSYTAKMINKNTGRDGILWQDESYDHIVRSESQLHFLIKYIEDNPIKAGLKKNQYWIKSVA